MTDCAASTLAAAVTAETTMSASRTASAADERAAHADRRGGGFQFFAVGLREQNVPGGDALDAGLAQPRRDRLAGFAKADETERWLVVCHIKLPLASLRAKRSNPVSAANAGLLRRSAPRNDGAGVPGMTLLMTRRDATLRVAFPQKITIRTLT